MQYGYIRVSTKEQNTDRQWDALAEYQIPRKNIYYESVVNGHADRGACTPRCVNIRQPNLYE